ncbi:nitroreductase family protein [Marivirga harenae]|uniref:nitroreductase family protein n=1 Tax=Marivirga harenae TaxID=2010992 RepID=UPI0026DEF0B8|nr:nitroreductase family protein [Marivirga harenae]WKV10684.1 nitroreductase family protein [Marivirga harenae]|tara:strand:- start:64389 stop:65069 length:681 start_codon:yes stop_codon:yes gene_type:complete
MNEKLIKGHPHILLKHQNPNIEILQKRSDDFYLSMDKRRSVREFSDKKIPRVVIENIVKTASTAPSGAHKQPWTFCIISNPALKKKIRIAAEAEEKESYDSRMSDQWLKDLEPIGTDWEKPFLETVPYIIVVFKKIYDEEEGQKKTNYYVNESVGIACGFLISAIHQAGLATLTHTPSPMNFLSEILERPKNERPYLLLPVGYPAEETYVPKLGRKGLEEMAKFYD